MEYGSIEREIHIAAEPAVVYEVISSPGHLREWWPDDATLDPAPGGVGELVFSGDTPGTDTAVPITVVAADPPRHFAFRWAYESAHEPDRANSYLVTFDLLPTPEGTTVRFRETGFREQGWDIATLEAAYHDHVAGWNFFLPRLVDYAQRVAVS